MKRSTILLFLMLFVTLGLHAQKVTGYIYDVKTSEPLVGVNVSYKFKGDVKATFSDAQGKYEVNVPADGIILTFSYMGYNTENYPLVLSGKQVLEQNVGMSMKTELLDEIVVSAGRFEQKLSDVTVSMEVIKPENIARQDPRDLRAALSTISGVEINDKQPAIRGGSGWTYGVGSRSMILVDGMSILTPGVGEINWNTIPMENVQQVEVLKGASSVLYGSSALNGIINVRTKRPSIEPETNISAYVGIYGSPENKDNRWWSREFWKKDTYPVEPFLRNSLMYGVRNPIYNGLEFSHSRRIGNYDVSGGANLFVDEGYRVGNYNKRMRLGGNLTHHNPDIPLLNYGFNINFLSNDFGDFFLWRSDKEVYDRSPLANMGRQANIFYLDPFFNYTNPDNNTSHKFKGRFYYKSDAISESASGKNLVEIVRNMGAGDKHVQAITDAIQDPNAALKKYLNKWGDDLMPLFEQDLVGAVEAIKGIGTEIFPNAKHTDYVDLISWVMKNPPPPLGSHSDYTQWALNTISPEKIKAGTEKTYSYYFDYQFSKQFTENSVLTAGATYEHVGADSRNTGKHESDNIGLFVQYDHQFFDKLNISVGSRFEYYRVDEHKREAETNIFGKKIPVKPVFRGGLNYQLADYTFLRASFGQGYRYPSITEKFIIKNIGGVGAYPNGQLRPEHGYNAEIGLKQAYKFGPFMGYIDVATFYTRYKDMIEFNVGVISTDQSKDYPFVTNLRQVGDILASGYMPQIGVKFSNVGRAEIYGVDFSINGFCDISNHLKFIYSLGYVYTEPRDMDADKVNREEAASTDIFDFKSKSNTSKYLKYRQKHSAKAVLDLQWERFSIGANLAWKSKTLAVDYFLTDERVKPEKDVMNYVRDLIFGDIDGYWKKNNKDYFVMDLRLGAQVTNQVDIQCIITNLLNKEYSSRPMDVAAPRTVMIKAGLKF